MIRGCRCLVVLFLIVPSASRSEEKATLTVTVTNIPAAKGELLVGLYDSAESFTASPLPQSPKIPLVSTEGVVARIENLPTGTYAVAVIQDLNGNGELDRNFLGIPKEPLAFSVIRKIPRGKPSFEACSFELKGDLEMSIALTTE